MRSSSDDNSAPGKNIARFTAESSATVTVDV